MQPRGAEMSTASGTRESVLWRRPRGWQDPLIHSFKCEQTSSSFHPQISPICADSICPNPRESAQSADEFFKSREAAIVTHSVTYWACFNERMKSGWTRPMTMLRSDWTSNFEIFSMLQAYPATWPFRSV